MASVATQYGSSTRETVNAANLKNSRLNGSSSNRNQSYVNRFDGGIGRPLQEVETKENLNLSDRQQLEKSSELRGLQQKSSLKNRVLGKKVPRKVKLLLARSQRRIKRHQRPIWILNFIIAGYLDILNPIIAAIPYIGWILGPILSFCGGGYINFSLWRIGNIKTRTKRRAQRGITSLLNSIPYINFIPFSLVPHANLALCHLSLSRMAKNLSRQSQSF